MIAVLEDLVLVNGGVGEPNEYILHMLLQWTWWLKILMVPIQPTLIEPVSDNPYSFPFSSRLPNFIYLFFFSLSPSLMQPIVQVGQHSRLIQTGKEEEGGGGGKMCPPGTVILHCTMDGVAEQATNLLKQ